MTGRSNSSRWTGDAIMFGTAMLLGSSYPFAKDVLGVMSPLLYGASRYLVASLFLMAMMALLRRPIALLFDSPREFLELDARLGVYWLYTAIFPVGVAYLGLTAGLDRLGVSRVMVYMYLIPVAGVGLSAAFFGDPLTAARVLGGLIVLLGVVLTRLALDRGPRVPV